MCFFIVVGFSENTNYKKKNKKKLQKLPKHKVYPWSLHFCNNKDFNLDRY